MEPIIAVLFAVAMSVLAILTSSVNIASKLLLIAPLLTNFTVFLLASSRGSLGTVISLVALGMTLYAVVLIVRKRRSAGR